MGIFDIFGTGDQKAAANDQIAGITTGLNTATNYINQGSGALTGNYGQAINSLAQNFGVGNNALTGYAGYGANALTGGAGQAANELTSNYSAALQPFQQNYNQAQAGVNQLGNVLGLNGAAGNASALNALQNTPGYQFQLQQGDAAVNAAAAANGTLNSGNQLTALSNYNQGLASTTYNNYVSQLQPYLGASAGAASGIAGVNTGLGNSLAGNSNNLGSALNANYSGLGQSLNANATGLGGATAGLYQGQGNALMGQYNNLANLAYGANTGIGNANANKDLAGLTASGNILGAIGSVGGAILGGIGGMPGLGSSIGSSLMGAVPGAVGPSSVGGAPLSSSAYSSIFSDERLKEDISKVGELVDGQPVYKYRYIGSPVFQIGLMAQDVEKTNPDAVTQIGGFKAVDYGKATKFAADMSRFLEAA